ncbi:MAG TPA: ribbon-helix-helix protein, CopG family [Solirubrobacteraceae bacterium]|nr:ribbon-helix-helix protein, CopG family [Solirubrobacteraceae bacterium]
MPKLPDGMAQRPVIIPEETAEWFRELAYRTRISQQEHFRRALNEYRDKVEREAQPENDEIDRGLALVRRLAAGEGVDLELLRDADRRMWGLE